MIKITGVVKKGKKEARKLGFKTLNIHSPVDIFSKGVFYGTVYINNNIYNSVIYIGDNREQEDEKYQCIEAHLLDSINYNYYDAYCTIKIIKKIRNDKK